MNAQDTTCQVCETVFHEPARPGVPSKRCTECKAHDRRVGRKPAPCPACGQPKPWGKRRLCPACTENRKPIWERAAERKRKERQLAGWVEQLSVDPTKLSPKARARVAPEGTKWCSRCEDYLPITEFRPNGAGRLNSHCVICWDGYCFEKRLSKDYGLTVGDYEALLAAQDGRCFICKNRPRKQRLAVDHDHKTGMVRGLLCRRCNQSLLGAAREDPAMLRRAADYLEHPPAVAILSLVADERPGS